MHTKIEKVDFYFPGSPIPIGQIQDRVTLNSPGVKLPVGTISRLTGVKQVHHRATLEDASDLARKAGDKVLKAALTDADEIDLLIFASASQDLIEPATAHIVADKMGLSCPVMDVKNACNSFINGLQVADSLIKTGSYKKVLIVTGETPSVSARWKCGNREEFIAAFPGYSMSDSGGAILLSATENEEESSDIKIKMSANSEMWDVGVLDTGGSRNPRDPDTTYFYMDGAQLFNAFKTVGSEFFFKEIADGLDWSIFTRIGAHQVSEVYNEILMQTLRVPADKLFHTINTYGNVASNSLPLQLKLMLDSGALQRGDTFAFIGLGAGISTGLVQLKV